jgi:hypothetical protein
MRISSDVWVVVCCTSLRMAFERRDAGAVRSRGARQALVNLLCLALLFGGSLVGLLHTPLLSIALSFLSQIGCIERCLLRTSNNR